MTTTLAILTLIAVGSVAGLQPHRQPLLSTTAGRVLFGVGAYAVLCVALQVPAAALWVSCIECAVAALMTVAAFRLMLDAEPAFDFSYLPAFIDAKRGAYRWQWGMVRA